MLGAVLLAVVATSPASVTAPGGTAAGLAVVPARADGARMAEWHLSALGATDAWRESTGEGVTVAVVDSGVDSKQADLAGQVIVPGRDFVMPGGDGTYDPAGHGTAVATLIAGRSDDAGVEGLAPDVKILPVRVLNEQRRYDDPLVVAQGIRFAVDYGAKVINLSLGGATESDAIRAAIEFAFAHDVVVVACTGNVGAFADGDQVWYPAREPGVIAVAGMDKDTIWAGSVTGPQTVLTAPAAGLQAPIPGGGYGRVYGTSFAAPLVSATAALVRSKSPSLKAGDVVNRLITTAADLGQPGRDDTYGYGEVDPLRALTEVIPMIGRNPLGDVTPLGESGFGPAPGVGAAGAPIEAGASGVAAAWPTTPSDMPQGTRWIRLGAILTVLVALTAATAVCRTRVAATRPDARIRPPPG
jgi:type VII secretion-associated serine protease mycosin